MESFVEWWKGIMDIKGVAWIIYPTLLVVLVVVAYYVINLLRNLALGGAPANQFDYLGEFRRMRDEGHLDSEEYKKLTGLVPLPEVESGPVQPEMAEDSANALTSAAKDVIRKAAAKNKNNGDSDSDESASNGLSEHSSD